MLETTTTDQRGAGGDFRMSTRVKSRLISTAALWRDSEDVSQAEIALIAAEF